MGPASMTVPSTVRSKPSESAAICGRGRRMRLHLSAPCAQQAPQCGERQPENALRAECGDNTHCRREKESKQHNTGPQPDDLRKNDSCSEEPRRVKERSLTGVRA
jgi:ribosomal protein L32